MRRNLRAVRLKHLNRSGEWPSGNPRLYYRPPGQKGVALPDLPMTHPAFLRAYAEASEGRGKASRGPLSAFIVAYLGSEHYKTRAASTQSVWRRYLDDTRRLYGDARFAEIEARHIRKDLSRFGANEANNRLKAWRAICKWAVSVGAVDMDAARDVAKRQTPRTDGHVPWAAQDVVAFRAKWPVGTAQRLAFEVMHHTGAAVIDAISMGEQNVAGGWIVYTQQKSGTLAAVPFDDPAPWLGLSDDLHQCLAARKDRHMVWLTTRAGHPRSPKSVSQWFSAACRAAGVDKTAHGIRKYRAEVMRENGATPDQRMAVLGHDTTRQEAHYSKGADLRRIITGTESSKSAEPVGKRTRNMLKTKEILG